MTKEAPRWPQDGPYANLPRLHKICPGKFALRKIWLSKSRALRIARRAKFARAAGRQILHNTTIPQFWTRQILRKLGVAQTCVHVGRVAFAAAAVAAATAGCGSRCFCCCCYFWLRQQRSSQGIPGESALCRPRRQWRVEVPDSAGPLGFVAESFVYAMDWHHREPRSLLGLPQTERISYTVNISWGSQPVTQRSLPWLQT